MSRERVLIIADDCGISDALRMAPAVLAVRRGHPDAEVTLLADTAALPLIERLGACDLLVPSGIYKKREPRRWRLHASKVAETARVMAKVGTGYDLAVVFGWGTTLLDVLARFAARRVVGFPNRWADRLLVSRLPPWDRHGRTLEEQCASLALAAGGSPVEGVATPLATPADREAATALMGAAGLGGSPFVVLHPGSDWACQQWPVERWAGLADELIESRGLAVALTGSSGEREYVEQIRSRMRSPATSFAGKTSLGEVEALLAHATLCICVDSAVRDLARAAGVETLVLAGHRATTGAQRTADPLSRLVVLSRTPASLQASIDSCKDGFYRYGQCHDTSCPMSGLRDIAVADVLAAVEARLPALRSAR